MFETLNFYHIQSEVHVPWVHRDLWVAPTETCLKHPKYTHLTVAPTPCYEKPAIKIQSACNPLSSNIVDEGCPIHTNWVGSSNIRVDLSKRKSGRDVWNGSNLDLPEVRLKIQWCSDSGRDDHLTEKSVWLVHDSCGFQRLHMGCAPACRLHNNI